MTITQAAMLYEMMRSVDVVGTIEEICREQQSHATNRVLSALDRGSMQDACIARGEEKAWGNVAGVLKRAARKAAPDQS